MSTEEVQTVGGVSVEKLTKTYIKIREAKAALKAAFDKEEESLQEKLDAIKRALLEPLRKIATNAGVEGAVVINKVKEGQGAYGFNARTEVYEDLEKAGVIDPTKVERTALQNAASVASLLLTTEAMVAERPKKKAKGGAGGGAGGGMPDYGGDDMDY